MTNLADIPTPAFAIIICSKGRPDILSETVRSIASQTVQAQQFLVVVTEPQDIDEAALLECGIPSLEILFSKPGLTLQRNVGNARLRPEIQYACYFDDDMELQRDYIRLALGFLEKFPTVMALSGRMLRESCDSRAEAQAVVEAYRPNLENPAVGQFRNRGEHWVLHGCNMVVRASILAYENFDERLPLYSYLEDYDFSVRIRHYGYVGRFRPSVGVHLRTTSGRTSGLRVGYSQIANNWYFLQKGVCHLSFPASHLRFGVLTLRFILRHARACLSSARREDSLPFLRGNLLALKDLLSGKCRPDRILEI